LRLLAGDLPGAICYEFQALRASGLWVHAPGTVEASCDQPGSARFTIKASSLRPSFVLIHRPYPGPASTDPPVVRLDGQPAPLAPPHRYLSDRGTLILAVQGSKPVAVEIQMDR
jgi:hypothetical protein